MDLLFYINNDHGQNFFHDISKNVYQILQFYFPLSAAKN
jgi:hypothetical protein